METRKLQVGDKVYNESHQRYSANIHYTFATVVRLTKTRAVLDNETVLINEPETRYGANTVSFGVYGYQGTRWYFETPEIIEKAKAEELRQNINRWFDAKKFTEEERAMIYGILTMSEAQLKQLKDYQEAILEVIK